MGWTIAYNQEVKKQVLEAKDAPLHISHEYDGRNILFLDVDGVLNCLSTRSRICECIGIDDEKISILKEIVTEHDFVIVLSSSWKENWHRAGQKDQQDEMADYLDEHLALYGLTISDKTEDTLGGFYRGHGIIRWLDEHPGHGRWLVLDDECFADFKECGITKHQIRTSFDPNRGGLQKKHIRIARNIVKKQVL